MKYIIPKRDWAVSLLRTINIASDGDVIVVHTPEQKATALYALRFITYAPDVTVQILGQQPPTGPLSPGERAGVRGDEAA